MFKLRYIGNNKMVTSIASKCITKCFRKNLGLKTAKVECKDILVMEREDGRYTIHLNADFDLNRDELLALIDRKMGEAE